MLRSTIGPAEPTPQVCRESTSVTCTLMDNQLQFAASMADLVSQCEALAATLQPEVLTNTQSQFAALSTGIDEMIATVDDLHLFLGRLRGISGVARTRTTVVLSTWFEGRPHPMPSDDSRPAPGA